jgi:predicted AlkP superfamily phosphohydrolase/phosphomutase
MLAFLQFDAASMELLEAMLRAGRLPALSALRAKGVLGPLEPSTTLFEAAIYPELYTGVDVEDHALYSAIGWVPGEQRMCSWFELEKPATVWERLARGGRRSLVVDPYQGWPTRDGRGLWISGWQFQNRMIVPRWEHPRGAFGALRRELGGPPSAETVFGRPSLRTLLGLRTTFVEAPRRAADLVERALAREPFDFVWVGFSNVHLAGHYLWDRSLVADADLDERSQALLDAAMADVYEATDAALGRIVAALPTGADVVVFSPDGMGPNTSRSDLLPGMLAAVLGEGTSANGNGAGDALWRWRARIPTAWRGAAARFLSEETACAVTARLQTLGMDWSRTRAFAVQGDHYGFVRLNLRGRERDGIVAPADADALLEIIADGLMTFRDPDGAPSVAEVTRTRDAVPAGDRSVLLPDLVVRWSARDTARLVAVTSPRFGEVARHGAGPGMAGNHTAGAWSLLVPGAGRLATLHRAPRLVDLAATACAHAGVAADGLPGMPLLEPAG